RRSSVWKLDMPGMVKCPNCGEYVLSHRVCKACGYYDGKQVLKMNNEEAK
ncbi:MAG: 50S ribosomal protein L32, partial [Clostridia bacterium]|nr:50S ribosomal protein L32 [Clostridia bacterium]